MSKIGESQRVNLAALWTTYGALLEVVEGASGRQAPREQLIPVDHLSIPSRGCLNRIISPVYEGSPNS